MLFLEIFHVSYNLIQKSKGEDTRRIYLAIHSTPEN